MLVWAYYLACAVIVAILLWKYRNQVVAYLELLRQQLVAWWGWWRGQRPSAVEPPATAVAAEPRRVVPFSAYSHPFRGTASGGRSAAELVRYTFAALEAWGREHGWQRHADQTPLEFAQALGIRFPDVARPARDVCDLYGRVVYGDGRLPPQTAEILSRCWDRLIAQPTNPDEAPSAHRQARAGGGL